MHGKVADKSKEGLPLALYTRCSDYIDRLQVVTSTCPRREEHVSFSRRASWLKNTNLDNMSPLETMHWPD